MERVFKARLCAVATIMVLSAGVLAGSLTTASGEPVPSELASGGALRTDQLSALADRFDQVEQVVDGVLADQSVRTSVDSGSDGSLSRVTDGVETAGASAGFQAPAAASVARTPGIFDGALSFSFGDEVVRVVRVGDSAAADVTSEGASASHLGVRDGLDVHYVGGDAGIEELLHVSGTFAASVADEAVFEWQLALPTGWRVAQVDERAAVLDAAGIEVLRMSAPWAQDAAGTTAQPRVLVDSVSNSISVRVSPSAAGFQGDWVLDPLWQDSASIVGAYQWTTCGVHSVANDGKCAADGVVPAGWLWSTSSGDGSKFTRVYDSLRGFGVLLVTNGLSLAANDFAGWEYTPPTGVKIQDIWWVGRQINRPSPSAVRCQVSVTGGSAPGPQTQAGGTGDFNLEIDAGSTPADWFSTARLRAHIASSFTQSLGTPLNGCLTDKPGTGGETTFARMVLVDTQPPAISAASFTGADSVFGPKDQPFVSVTLSETGSGLRSVNFDMTDQTSRAERPATLCRGVEWTANRNATRPCSLTFATGENPVRVIWDGDQPSYGAHTLKVWADDFATSNASQTGATMSFTWDDVAPSAPTAVVAASDGPVVDGMNVAKSTGALDLSWTDATDTYGIDRHEALIVPVERQCPVTSPGWYTVSSSPDTIPSLSLVDGGQYLLCLRAVDDAGNVGPSVSTVFSVDATAPAAPTSVVDGASGADIGWSDDALEVDARWSAVADSGSGLGGYETCVMALASTCTGPDWVAAGTATTGLLDLPPSADSGDEFKVCVRAIDRAGNIGSSACSNGFMVCLGPRYLVHINCRTREWRE